mgnify:CR=1 FL=1
MRRHVQATIAILFLILLSFLLVAGPAGAESIWSRPPDVPDPDAGPSRVYFPTTGHSVAGAFLSYWRAHGGLSIFGYPLTEPMRGTSSGSTIQYFERAIFESKSSSDAEGAVQLRLVGSESLPVLANNVRHSQQLHLQLAWANGVNVSMPDPFARVPRGDASAEARYFDETGHTLSGVFRSFWEGDGETAVLGYPISEMFRDPSSGLIVQCFERAIMEQQADENGQPVVTLQRLGAAIAKHDGINTAPAPQGDIPVYDPAFWQVVAPAGAPVDQPKWIEVDLSKQTLRAWEYDTRVYGTYVSTGLPDTPTPAGLFHIFAKYDEQDMAGWTTATGEYYYVPNVPYVMYFAEGGYAFHAAWWHRNFGHPMSPGCVNLATPQAAWLYDWAPLGTVVFIHT